MKPHKENTISIIKKIILTVIALTIFEFLALTLTAMIPQQNIEGHVNESADILLGDTVFFYINNNDIASRIDRYADSILLNIAYSYNNEHPVTAVARSSYYYTDTQNENQNLKDAVVKQKAANKDYIRYWHGSNIIVKPLLLFMNINGIYIFNAIVLSILLIIFLILLWKKIGSTSSICMLLSCIAISVWYVPFSLEYTWTMILMLVASIISLYMNKQKVTNLLFFFIIVGNITAYFDFLTTETLTFTIPTICIILMQDKNNMHLSFVDSFKLACQSGICWLIGYTSAWIMKWTIASVILQTNAFQLAFQQASTRVSGEAINIPYVSQSLGAFVRNASCLVPFNYINENAFFFFVATVGIMIIIYYLFKRKEKQDTSNILFLIALVPYIRFLLLSNHSYIHYFFTYRAQLASIFAFCLAIIYGIDYTYIKREWRKLWKHQKKH